MCIQVTTVQFQCNLPISKLGGGTLKRILKVSSHTFLLILKPLLFALVIIFEKNSMRDFCQYAAFLSKNNNEVLIMVDSPMHHGIKFI